VTGSVSLYRRTENNISIFLCGTAFFPERIYPPWPVRWIAQWFFSEGIETFSRSFLLRAVGRFYNLPQDAGPVCPSLASRGRTRRRLTPSKYKVDRSFPTSSFGQPFPLWRNLAALRNARTSRNFSLLLSQPRRFVPISSFRPPGCYDNSPHPSFTENYGFLVC